MIHIFDGAMGTMLQQAGLEPGQCPEVWNLENPEAITAIHKQYIDSGATIIETNTFGANRIKLSHYGLQDKVPQLNESAVKAARAAAGAGVKVAGSIGPTGKFIAPLGDLSFDDAYAVFAEQIAALDQAGVDLFIIETIIDIQEMRAALLAVKTLSVKPVICQLSFGSDGRTVTGTDPETAAIILEAMGADIIGANCSLGPAQLLPIIEIFGRTTRCEISVQPNAGMPELINGETIFPMNAEEMAEWVPKLIAAGATYIGGCCGTTPLHITAVAKAAADVAVPKRQLPSLPLALTSRSKTVYISPNSSTVIIGERINPTGRKQLAADIKAGSFLSVKKEAIEQVKAGAHILDVNMGVPGINQSAIMQQAIEELSMLVDVPLAIDTSDPSALEAGLKAYPGRALINSISAEPERLATFLPLAKKYGAAILCLPIAASGVPKTAQERVEIVQQIITSAKAIGIKENAFLLDALVMTVAADQEAAIQTLATLKAYRQHFGYPATMGLSNISFGLPNRPNINSTFCAMSLLAGLDAPILNPYDKNMQDTLAASAALLGYDTNGKGYSLKYAAAATVPQQEIRKTEEGNILDQIRQSVVNGEKEGIVPLIHQALKQDIPSDDITEQGLTAAMNEIGEAFGAGRSFLPQVLLAAETMREAFQTIKQILPAHQTIKSQGTVVLATVKGDIHDLGKNIVAALLENSGFTVIDLGKDVPCETIVAEAAKNQADIIGLCALMTTTMPQIDIVINKLKNSDCKAHTIVGGAVLTAEYAKQAGADAYAPDAVAAVAIAKQIVKGEL